LSGVSALLLGGCAAGPQLHDHEVSGPAVELKDVPYAPLSGYQGGPAALAMMLGASGVQVSPDDLVPQVYDAKKDDTPRYLLTAVTSHYGRVPYVLYSRQMDLTVVKLVQSGHPVMVLLHRGLLGKRWEFAVVIGVDPEANSFILRTATDERETIGYGDLVEAWRDGRFWAMLTQRPGDIPEMATARDWIAAAAPLEQNGKPEAAAQAYAAATQRWPKEPLAWEGLGNAYYALHNLRGATTAFQNALSLAPNDTGAHNNLAQVLLERQCADQAEDEINRALALETDPARRAVYQRTRQQVLQRGGPSVVCSFD
jgi:hypothetical protein